jgi:hypothetical protein
LNSPAFGERISNFAAIPRTPGFIVVEEVASVTDIHGACQIGPEQSPVFSHDPRSGESDNAAIACRSVLRHSPGAGPWSTWPEHLHPYGPEALQRLERHRSVPAAVAWSVDATVRGGERAHELRRCPRGTMPSAQSATTAWLRARLPRSSSPSTTLACCAAPTRRPAPPVLGSAATGPRHGSGAPPPRDAAAAPDGALNGGRWAVRLISSLRRHCTAVKSGDRVCWAGVGEAFRGGIS